MVNLTPIFKPWQDTPAFGDYIDIVGFVEDGVFLTKTMQVGVMLRVSGLDYESLTRVMLDSYTTRLESALRLFDPRFRLYQYFFRTDHPQIPGDTHTDPVVNAIVDTRLQYLQERGDSLFTNEFFLAVLLQIDGLDTSLNASFRAGNPTQIIAALKSSFSPVEQLEIRDAQLIESIDTLRHQVLTFTSLVADFLDVRCEGNAGCYSVLRRLVTVDPALRVAPMPDGAADYTGYFLADQTLRVERNHLQLDDYFVRVLTLKSFPSATSTNLLRPLQQVRGNYHIVATWHAEPPESTLAVTKSHIAHNDSTKINPLQAWLAKGGPVRPDRTKDVTSDHLEAVNIAIVNENCRFGHYSFTVVVYDKDPSQLNRVIADMMQAAHKAGIGLIGESYATILAFLATIPGAHRYDKRLKRISERNNADLSFFYSLSVGHQRNDFLGTEYLALLTTTNDSLYYFNLHQGEVAHTLVLGPTGSGKSFLVAYLAGQSAKYKPAVRIIDLGGSYESLTHLLGGVYNNVAADDSALRFNPFTLPDTPANRDFLTTFVCALLEQGTSRNLSQREKNDIFHKVSDLYESYEPSTRRLSILARTLPEDLADRLARWLYGDGDTSSSRGQYGHIFDHPDCTDSLSDAMVQTFNFAGFDDQPDMLEPLLFYILHRTTAVIDDPLQLDRFKFFILDEAWSFFRNPRLKAYVLNGLKTWRKRNAAVLFATQALTDLHANGLIEDVVSACVTKLFLPNPALDSEMYQRVFSLTPDACEQIKRLIPRQQFLLSTPTETKVLNLITGPEEYWLYANNPQANTRRRRALERFGSLALALKYLAAHPQPDEIELAQAAAERTY